MGLPGAIALPFLAEPTLSALARANQYLAAAENTQLEIVLWEGYRSYETQSYLYQMQLAAVRREAPDASDSELQILVEETVENPNRTFAHGTGGALDVTLSLEGTLLDMGSHYGDRSERSRRDYFAGQSPITQADRRASYYRGHLRAAMEHAGFVSRELAWWHFEIGTAQWAREKDRSVLLDRVLAPPPLEGPAVRPPIVPDRYSAWQSGVSRPFLSVSEGALALHSEPPGHYYARVSHPGGDSLANLLNREVLGGTGAVLCSSGLSACLQTVAAVIERGRTLLYADDIYYQCKVFFRREADRFGWKPQQTKSPLDSLRESENVGLVYVDSPSNWHLKCYDLEALAAAAHDAHALLIVDVTLQPCQDALLQGADIVVSSLSKDVSLGHTSAGVVAASDPALIARIAAAVAARGEMVTAETAHIVYQHAISLRDRLQAQNAKVKAISELLANHPTLSGIQIADTTLCGGLTGSQLSLQLVDPIQGQRFERLVGQRSLDADATLHLGSTFGAVYTSVEHFASRAGLRIDGSRRSAIPDNFVRVGVGCEQADRIIADLAYSLNASSLGPTVTIPQPWVLSPELATNGPATDVIGVGARR